MAGGPRHHPWTVAVVALAVSGASVLTSCSSTPRATPTDGAAACARIVATAVDLVDGLARLAPGAPLCVRGDHHGDRLLVGVSGRPGAPVVVRGLDGARVGGVVVRADDVRIEGVVIDTSARRPTTEDGAGVLIAGRRVAVSGVRVEGAAADGIVCDPTVGCDGAEIRDDAVRGADGSGIVVIGDDVVVERNDVSESVSVHADDADGVRFFGRRLTFRQNHIHDITPTKAGVGEADQPHSDCFQTFWWEGRTVDDVTIEDNVCTGVGAQCAIATALPPADRAPARSGGLVVRGNVCDTLGAQAVYLAGITGALVTGNRFGPRQRFQAVAVASGSTGIEVRDNVVLGPVALYAIDDSSRSGVSSSGNVRCPGDPALGGCTPA